MSGIVLSADNKSLSLVPASFNDIMTLARTLASSSLIPSVLRNKPEDVAIILATGLEFGFSPFVSLRQIYVVEGRPALSADAQLAVVLNSRECEYFRLVESTAQSATYETLRRGWPSPSKLTYTIEDARNAGLANKPNWKLNPLKMLQNRAKSTLAGAVYSDLLLGMPSVEEASEAAGFERARDVTPSSQANPEDGSRVLDAIKGGGPVSVSVSAAPDVPEGVANGGQPQVQAASASKKPAQKPVEAKPSETPKSEPAAEGDKGTQGSLLDTLSLSYDARAKYEEVRANTTATGLHKWRQRRDPELQSMSEAERRIVLDFWEQRLEEVSE